MKKLKFHYAEYPAAEYEIWLAALPYAEAEKRPLTLPAWAAREGADIVYPLAMYNMVRGRDRWGEKYGRTLQYVRAKGADAGYGGGGDILALGPPHAHLTGKNSAGGYENACAGYKTAVVRGAIAPGLDRTARRSRNVNGLTGTGEYFHLVTEKDVTEYECAEYLKARGAALAIMQDGGGTTAKYENGRVAFAPEGGRPTCSVVCIRRRKGEEEPMREYENGAYRTDVFETSACRKKTGSLDPFERCALLYEERGCAVVMYYVTGAGERKVGFVKK